MGARSRPPTMRDLILLRAALLLLLVACCTVTAGGGFLPALALTLYMGLRWGDFAAVPRAVLRAVQVVAGVQALGSVLVNAAVGVAVLFPHRYRSSGKEGASAFPLWLQMGFGVRWWRSPLDSAVALTPPIALLLLTTAARGRSWPCALAHSRSSAALAARLVRWSTAWLLCGLCVAAGLSAPSLLGAAVSLGVSVVVCAVQGSRGKTSSDARSRESAVPFSRSSALGEGEAGAAPPAPPPPPRRRTWQRRGLEVLSAALWLTVLLLCLLWCHGVHAVVATSVGGDEWLALLAGVCPAEAGAEVGGLAGSDTHCPVPAALSALQLLCLALAACLCHAITGATALRDGQAALATRAGGREPSGLHRTASAHGGGEREEREEREGGRGLGLGGAAGQRGSNAAAATPASPATPLRAAHSPLSRTRSDPRRRRARRWLLTAGSALAVVVAAVLPSVPSLLLLSLTVLQTVVAGRPLRVPRALAGVALLCHGCAVAAQYMVAAAAMYGRVPPALVQLSLALARPDAGSGRTLVEDSASTAAAAYAVFPYTCWTALQLLLHAVVFLVLYSVGASDTARAGVEHTPRDSATTADERGAVDSLAGERLRGLLGVERAGVLLEMAAHVEEVQRCAAGPADEGLATLFVQLTGRLPTRTEGQRLLQATAAELIDAKVSVAAAVLADRRRGDADAARAGVAESEVREGAGGDWADEDDSLVRRRWWRGAFLALHRPITMCLFLTAVLLPGTMDAVHAVGALLLVCFATFPRLLFRCLPRALLAYATLLLLAKFTLSFLLVNGLVTWQDWIPGTMVMTSALFAVDNLQASTPDRVLYLLACAVAQQLLLACFHYSQCRDWADVWSCSELRRCVHDHPSVTYAWPPSTSSAATSTNTNNTTTAETVAAAAAASAPTTATTSSGCVSFRSGMSSLSLAVLLIIAVALGLWWPPSLLHEVLLIAALALCGARAWGFARLATLFQLGLCMFLTGVALVLAIAAIPQVAAIADVLLENYIPTCASLWPVRARVVAESVPSCLTDVGLAAPTTFLGPTPAVLYLSVWYLLLGVGAVMRAGEPPLALCRPLEALGGGATRPLDEYLPPPWDEPVLVSGIACLHSLGRLALGVAAAVGPYLAVWFSWLACAVAALSSPCLLNGVYLLGFLVDTRTSLLLAFNLRHTVAAYAYQLRFIPAITTTFSGIGGHTVVPVDALVGLVKKRIPPAPDDSEPFIPLKELPALVFVWRQVLVAIALVLRAATEPPALSAPAAAVVEEASEEPPPLPASVASTWQPTRCWLRFATTQLVPLCGFPVFSLSLLMALRAAQEGLLGVVYALALAITAMMGRYLVPRGGQGRLLQLLVTISLLLLFLVRLDELVHVLPLAGEHADWGAHSSSSMGPSPAASSQSAASESVAEPWRRWLWEGNGSASLAVLGALVVAALHQCGRSAESILALAACRASRYGGHRGLIGYVQAQHLPALLTLTREAFERAIPDPSVIEGDSCCARVSTLVARAVAYTYPVALTSFLAGAASPPSILSALLLMGSLLLVAHTESLHVNFHRLWRPIARLYAVVPVVAIACQLPGGVGRWMQRNTGWLFTVTDGTVGGAFALSGLHAALLFAIVVQSEAYDSFYFIDVLTHLHGAASTRGERHLALRDRLHEEEAAEVRRVHAHDAQLREWLAQLRAYDPAAPPPAPPEATGAGAVAGEVLPVRQGREGEAAGVGGPPAGVWVRPRDPMATVRSRLSTPTAQVASPATPSDTARTTTTTAPLSGAPRKDTVDVITEYLARHTFRPAACAPAAVRNRGHRLLKALVMFLERHTTFATLLVAAANALYTGCLWDLVPLGYLLSVASVRHPFAPRRVYQAYIVYVVIGIALKASASVYVEGLLAREGGQASGRSPVGADAEAPRWLTLLSWTLLDVSGDGSYYWGRSANYTLALLDFLSFAVAGVHQSVCTWEGVYPPAVPPAPARSPVWDDSDRPATPPSPSPPAAAAYGPVYREGGGGDDPEAPEGAPGEGEGEGDVASSVSGSDHVSDPLSFLYERAPPRRPAAAAEGGRDDSRAPPRAGAGDSLTAPRGVEVDFAVTAVVGSDAYPVQSVPRGGAGPGWARRLSASMRALWANAVQVRGAGREYYVLYTTVDAIALVFLLLFYSHLTGNDAITLQVNVNNNLLPGSLVALICLSVLQMVAERMIYVRASMAAKVIDNYLCTVGYCGAYWLWRHLTEARSMAAGNTYFALKIISLTLSIWQVRCGFPRHRRHDPFTPYPGSAWRYYCYQALRTMPFLWEARTFIDWTMQTTSLRLEEYMKAEELYDIVYRRRVQLFYMRYRRAYLGRPVSTRSKLTVGMSRLLLILVTVLGPLLYYSSLNPSIAASSAGQLRLALSFMGTNTFYSAATQDTVSTPGGYRTWLARTRPTLSTYGLQEPERTLQLMAFSSCSSDLWLISPEALRLMVVQLQGAANGTSAVYITQTLELVKEGRLASGSAASPRDHRPALVENDVATPVEQLSTARWTVPAETASTLLQILQNHARPRRSSPAQPAEAELVNFYTPFAFSRGSDLQLLPATPPPHAGRNRMSCGLQLRVETDTALGSLARYWCIACDPLFTSGNLPTNDTTRFPEWPCLTEGRRCDQHNLEERSPAPAPDYVRAPARRATTRRRSEGASDGSGRDPQGSQEGSRSDAAPPTPPGHDGRTALYVLVLTDPMIAGISLLRRFSLVALYTTFALTLGRILRSVFAGSARAMIQTDMADPTAVGLLIAGIYIARDCGELALEQAGYLALVDLMRSPERLAAVTGARSDLFNRADGTLRMPAAFEEDELRQRWLRQGDLV